MSFNKKPGTINPNEVDPSVYYYDEVYDDMKDQESSHDKKQGESKTTKQGSKYIQGIIETADRRKSEKEIRKFKKYAKDREEAEARGELENTDVYISRSYEKKLEEVRAVLDKNFTDDQDSELNTFKRHKGDPEDSHIRPDQPSTSVLVSDPAGTTEPVPELTSCNNQAKKTRRHPKTIEERREYLREVLRKQTVGEAFEAAIQRYRQRKALGSWT